MASTRPRRAATETGLPSWSDKVKSGVGIDFGGMTMSPRRPDTEGVGPAVAERCGATFAIRSTRNTMPASADNESQVSGLPSIPIQVAPCQLTQYQAGGEVAVRSTPCVTCTGTGVAGRDGTTTDEAAPAADADCF